MTPDQHLSEIVGDTVTNVQLKYKKGQEAHGGNLREKPGMMKMLEDEVIDLITYKHTLRSQLEDVLFLLETKNVVAAKDVLMAILGEPVDN